MISGINSGLNFQNPMFKQPAHHDKKDDQGTGLSKEQFEQKAKTLGVPEHIISQGRKAVREWVMENKQGSNDKSEKIEKSEVEKKAENDKHSEYKVSIFV